MWLARENNLGPEMRACFEQQSIRVLGWMCEGESNGKEVVKIEISPHRNL